MTRRLPIVVAAVFVLVGLAGCAAPQPDPSPTPSLDREASTSLGLIGMWRVTADGADPDTWLRVDGQELAVWAPCGVTWASWSATDTAFLAGTTGGHPDCLPFETPWLTNAVGYRATGDGWELFDAGGGVTASLVVDGAPPPNPQSADSTREPPVVTVDILATHRRAALLPAGLTPADEDAVLGEWVPAPRHPSTAGVEFADGTWTASDGCNGGQGRWALPERGVLLTTSGPSTLMACDGVLVPSWIAQARGAGFDGEVLVLLDADGTELGRLARA